MSKTTYFMELLKEMKEQKDEILVFFIADVSRLSISHVHNAVKLEHHRLVEKLNMDASDYRTELFALLDAHDRGTNALIASVKAINRYLAKNQRDILCEDNDNAISAFAIALVNEYYS